MILPAPPLYTNMLLIDREKPPSLKYSWFSVPALETRFIFHHEPVDQRLARRCCTQTGAIKMVKKTAKKKVAKKVTKKTASRKSAASQMQDYASDIRLAGLEIGRAHV